MAFTVFYFGDAAIKQLGVEVLKIKHYLIIPAAFIPAIIVFLLQTPHFSRQNLTFNDLIFPIIVLLGSLLFIWSRYFINPAIDFLSTIQRVIRGDYRARFSCDEKNEGFYKLSLSFNQFMTIVEKQTDELVENRHLQNQMLENEKIYRSALELTCERVFEADLIHNKLIYGQEIYNRTFPFLKTELYGDIVESITENAIYYEDVDKFRKALNRQNLIHLFTTTDTTEVNVEYRQVNESGENVWLSATIIHLSEDDNQDLKVIGYVKNIDARKRSELEILKQSQRDGLTSLYNKVFTQSLIENYLLSEGSSGKHAAIMLDVDNFKHINDTFGHIQGDTALLQVAEKLQGLFRSTDIVGRIGGDEFFILLKNYVSSDKLAEKLTAVCDLFKDIFLDEGKGYRISGSIGVSLYPEDGKSYTELYEKADHALYYTKEHGKNCYSIYNHNFSDKIHKLPVDLAMVKNTDFQSVPKGTQIKDLA